MERYSSADSLDQVETRCLVVQGQTQLSAFTSGPGLVSGSAFCTQKWDPGPARGLCFQLGGWSLQTSLVLMFIVLVFFPLSLPSSPIRFQKSKKAYFDRVFHFICCFSREKYFFYFSILSFNPCPSMDLIIS